MKRVLCLYRVSTKQQVNAEDDIPVQRRECMDFISRMRDWEFVGERLEKGVSGFKISAEKRDAIIEIRQMAEKKQFDILLVFMFDRLGRREDETPFLVEWFISHGIEVWSTREGQQRIENRGDKLMNYIRFWMAGGESEKTSMRVKAAHTQMTTDGLWRGGLRPFGYKLVHNGRIGKKNRPLYDLAIDEVEGPIVQEIFHLVAHEGYGTYRASNYLNEKYPNPNKIWVPQTLRNMLRNPTYIGRLHMNDTLSEPIESLRLVSDEDFAFAKYATERHIQRKYPEARAAEDGSVPAEAKSKTQIFGASLLSGVLYCAHCGTRLTGTYCTRQMAHGAYHRPIYRCATAAIKAKGCTGQVVYSAAKIEEAVLQVVHQYFDSITTTVDSVWQEQAQRQLRSKMGTELRTAQNELTKLQKQHEVLKQEVVKALCGESSYPSDLLSGLIAEKEEAIRVATERVEECKQSQSNEAEKIRFLGNQYQSIKSWAAEFDRATPEQKKMILAKLIEKITVDRDYNIHIYFFVTQDEFRQSVSSEHTTVSEAERCEFAV